MEDLEEERLLREEEERKKKLSVILGEKSTEGRFDWKLSVLRKTSTLRIKIWEED